MASFRRKAKNPVGIALVEVGKKEPVKITNREIFETKDEKVIKILKNDEMLEEIGGKKEKMKD